MTDFTIDVGQLDRAAAAYEQPKTDLTSAHTKSQELRIPDGAFGRVPWLSDQLQQPYTDQVTACSEALGDVVKAMGDLIFAVKATAAAYRDTDRANEEAANLINDYVDLS